MSWLESQIDARIRLDEEMSERAYAQLASSVSNPFKVPKITASDDLGEVDGVVKACLKYNGVEAGIVPSGITDVEERIEWLCGASGTMHRAVHLEEGWHRNAFGAMVGYLDTGEPIALLPLGIRGYYYLEPQVGRKVIVNARVASHISDVAIYFYKPLPSRSLSVRDLFMFILRSFSPADYWLAVLATALVTLIGLLPAWANRVAFGVVAPSRQAQLILPIAALLGGVAISTALIGACRNLVMTRMSIKMQVATEAAMFARVLTLPPSFFKEYAAGDLAMRVGAVTLLSRQLVMTALGTGLTTLFSLAYVLQVLAFAPSLALPALLVTVIQTTLTILVTMLTTRFERETTEANAKVSGTVTALLSGIQKIKLAGAEDRAFAAWAQGYSAYARAAYNRPIVVLTLPALVSFIGLLGGIVIYYLAGTTGVTFDNFVAFNVAYGQVNVAIMGFAKLAMSTSQIAPMIDMIEPILEATPEVSGDKPAVTHLDGSIEVSDVSFRYGRDLPLVVHNLSLEIRRGEYVALVGKSGCGKSTIMRLLLGFERPERGAIFYGPHDVNKVDLHSLRQHIGTVMQDGRLFMGDIRSNITISYPSATEEDAWEAAEIAGIADDIRKMPMGMHTLVAEGSGGISGGQRQRIMIARAVCGHRNILMFDEATSALDNKTQKHVSDALKQLNCTRIVIAHRLSTVRHCDRILVLDGGRIVEEGTYEELMEKNGFFAQLVERQRLEGE